MTLYRKHLASATSTHPITVATEHAAKKPSRMYPHRARHPPHMSLEQCIVFAVVPVVARYRKDKAKEIAKTEARHGQWVADPKNGNGSIHREEKTACQRSSRKHSSPLFIHDKIFRTSLDSKSTTELQNWVSKAATLLDCPTGFNFPGVRAPIPQAWLDANSAMDGLKAGQAGKRYVTWGEAVQTFEYFMEAKGTPIPDSEEILLRAMRHREAEGDVLLSLGHNPQHPGPSTGMLYLDPTWLIELIRRLTDHNLVDTRKEGTLKNELEKYGEKHNPPLELDMLWEQHRQVHSGIVCTERRPRDGRCASFRR